MINLTEPKLCFLIASANDIKGLISYCYAKDYYILELKGYYKGNFEDSIIAFANESIDNDEFRKDVTRILEHFNQDCLIIKYKGETVAKKIFSDYSERPLGIVMYNTDSENVSYLYNGISFSFVEQKKTYFPKEKSEIRPGMILEYFNNKSWIEKKVGQNVEDEYEKFWKLLIKYNKVRISY